MRFYDEGEGNAREPRAGSLDSTQHLRSSPALKPDADDKNENRLRGVSLSSNGCAIPSANLQSYFKEETKFSATARVSRINIYSRLSSAMIHFMRLRVSFRTQST